MRHSVYTGSFAALERRCVEKIAELQQNDPLLEINFLIGSNILAAYLKRRLAETGRAAANIRFHTFLDLADRFSASREKNRKPRMPRLGSSIILEDILAISTPDVFAAVAAFPGFRDALLETFRDLRDAGVQPRDLQLAIEKGGSKDRQPHLSALADLYKRFREQVSLFYDVDDMFRSAIDNLLEAGHTTDVRQLFVYGIYDCTGQQSRFLSALKNAFEVTCFIPYVDEGISGFALPFLRALADDLRVDPVQPREEGPAGSLGNLISRGFGLNDSRKVRNGEALASDGSFALVSAPGESRAAVEIVREILRAVRDGIIRGFHEAAVILRQNETEVPILAEVLRLRGIPYFIQGGSSFAERPLCKAIAAIVGLESNSYSREAVLGAMELTAASLPAAARFAWDVQSWRALTNGPRFLAGRDSWDAGTKALVAETESALRSAESAAKAASEGEEAENGAQSIAFCSRRLKIARALEEGWRMLRGASADWPSSLKWQEWVDFLDRRLEPILGKSADWALFLNALDEIGGLQSLADETKTFPQVPKERLIVALLHSVSSLTCREGRFQRSGVNLLSISAARGLRFPLVIIPGLDEGRFPAKLRQDPLLLDSERRSMDKLPIRSKRIEEEKLLFDMAARAAEKRLVLMTSRLDERSDRERIPSQFFLRAASAVRGSAVSTRDLSAGNIPGFRSVSLDNPAPAMDEIPVDETEIRLRAITADRNSAGTVLAALAQREPDRFRGPLAYDRARWMKKLTGFDGFLADPALVRVVAEQKGIAAGQVSASRIEEYVKCPYFFFLKRIMNLEPWEEQSYLEGMDPLERGLIIHSIVENFLKDLCGEKFSAASEDQLWNILNSQAQECFAESQPAAVPALLWEIERDALTVMLKSWLAFEKERASDDMRPSALEKVFGEFPREELRPAFCLQAGKHTFEFRGRIDRVDISRDGMRARVIDYKTGTLPDTMARRNTRTPLMSGEKIQIAVYKGALSVLSEYGKVRIVEGEYLHLQPKDARTVPCSYTCDELEQASQRLPGILEIVGDGIEGGVFFARTRGMVRPYGHCDFCDYLAVCGKDRVQREERKAGDPSVCRFNTILEPLT